MLGVDRSKSPTEILIFGLHVITRLSEIHRETPTNDFDQREKQPYVLHDTEHRKPAHSI